MEKRGKPKKIPNCLVRSPFRVQSGPVAEPEVVEANECVEAIAHVKKTTRTRKRNQPLSQDGLEAVPSRDIIIKIIRFSNFRLVSSI